MNESTLAKLMLDWERKRRELDEMEAAIRDSVLQLKESRAVGNVRATYYGGRKSYDYKSVGKDAPPSLVESYTKTTTRTYWRDLVLDGMGIDKEQIPFTQSKPSVKLKLID